MDSELTPFSLKLIAIIRRIPRGRVATYKQIAALAGREQAPRQVVWILKSCAEAHALPWHRVINARGLIGFKYGTSKFRLQRRLLKDEGVEVGARDGAVDLKTYQYRRWPKKRRRPPNEPRMFND